MRTTPFTDLARVVYVMPSPSDRLSLRWYTTLALLLPLHGAVWATFNGSGVPLHAPKIYKYNHGGTTSFSDIAPSKGAYAIYSPSCYACSITSNIDWHATQLHLDAYGEEINAAALAFRMEPALVRAVIHAESGFNARARSKKGAMGLMQLMPGTALDLGVVDALAPSQNIRGGVQYLATLMARFHNDVALATAAYNAGPGAVQKHAGVPPYAETQVYVQRVKILHQRYKALAHG